MSSDIETRFSSLKGKVAVVTGAAQGIGRAIAKAFAGAGASVVVTDIQEAAGEASAQTIRDSGQQALFVKADLSQENDIKAMIHAGVNHFGRLDVLINNARPRLRSLPFPESMHEWDSAMAVLLKAPALAAKHALPELLKSGGSIVNVSSTNAVTISHQPVAYHVAKAGLVQLTRYLAYELGPNGIRVNSICPGLVDLHDEGKQPLSADPVNDAVIELVVPLRKAASVQEISEAALFLCSDAASYITGQILTIDGGIMLGDHFGISRKVFLHAVDRSLP